MIEIVLNGEAHTLDAEIDLARLIVSLSLPDKRVAIELNGAVIRRRDWQETRVGSGDRVEVVHFVGGG